MRKIAFYRFLISYLVPELHSFEGAKIKAKSVDMKQGKSIEIDQICDITYIACRFDE